MKKIISAVLALSLISTQAFAGLTFSSTKKESAGSEKKIYGMIAFDSSYPTNGEAFSLSELGFNSVSNVLIESKSGYIFSYDYTNNKILVYRAGAESGSLANESSHTHAVALDGGTSAAGSAHTHVFTGTSAGDLNLATPAWSGTGHAAAGQVITTTDNQTMALNEAAGMWLISATGATPPVLILSNTAVTGAPAVLTVQGAATTDAGAYKIVKNIVPVGTNASESTHTHGPGTLADAASGAGSAHTHAFTGTAAALSEVSNGTNLATLTSVRFVAFGK